MSWSNDPVADAERYMADRDKENDEAIKCEHCGCVLSDFAYEINGDTLCRDCVDDIFGKEIF